MKVVFLLLLLIYLKFPTYAQEQTQSRATLAVAGSNEGALQMSTALVEEIRKGLEEPGNIQVVGQIRSGIRTGGFDNEVLAYAKEMGASGSLIVQFEPMKATPTVGFVHLSASTIAGDRRGTLVRYLDVKNPQLWQIKELSSWGVGFFDPKLIVVNLYIYTRPPNVFFRVGQTSQESTDQPGRTQDEGYGTWKGNRLEGLTEIVFYKPPDYVRVSKQVQITKNGGNRYCQPPDGGFCDVIEVVLEKTSEEKKAQ